MYNDEYKIYVSIDFDKYTKSGVHTTAIHAKSKLDAKEGFNQVFCGHRKLSQIREIPRVKSIDELGAFDRELIDSARNDYLFFNESGNYWRRSMSINNKGKELTELIVSHPTKKLFIEFLGIDYQSDPRVEGLVRYVSDISRIHTKNASYETFDTEHNRFDIQTIATAIAASEYDATAFVIENFMYADLGYIWAAFDTLHIDPPKFYKLNRKGVIEELCLGHRKINGGKEM